MTGNPGISAHGAAYAAGVRDASDRRLAEAKLQIEAEIRRGDPIKGGRLTAQAVLQRAGLKPHFLSKPARKDTNASLRIWIDQQNARIGLAKKRAMPETDEKLVLRSLREEFVRLQNAYVKDSLKGVGLSRELKAEKVRVAELKAENARLREHLRSAGLSEGP